MSAFDGFCEAKELDQDQGDWFADFCKNTTGLEPYLLSWDEVRNLYYEFCRRAALMVAVFF